MEEAANVVTDGGREIGLPEGYTYIREDLRLEPAPGKHPLIALFPAAMRQPSLLFTTVMPWLFLGVGVALAALYQVFQPSRVACKMPAGPAHRRPGYEADWRIPRPGSMRRVVVVGR